MKESRRNRKTLMMFRVRAVLSHKVSNTHSKKSRKDRFKKGTEKTFN